MNDPELFHMWGRGRGRPGGGLRFGPLALSQQLWWAEKTWWQLPARRPEQGKYLVPPLLYPVPSSASSISAFLQKVPVSRGCWGAPLFSSPGASSGCRPCAIQGFIYRHLNALLDPDGTELGWVRRHQPCQKSAACRCSPLGNPSSTDIRGHRTPPAFPVESDGCSFRPWPTTRRVFIP